MISAALTDPAMDVPVAPQRLEARQRLEAFLREVEARALRLTALQVGDADEALDIVQDAMIRLARRYATHASEQWRPLFFRILQNRTRDWHRRQAVKRRIFGFLPASTDGYEEPLAGVPGQAGDEPLDALERSGAMHALQSALGALPARQREAFVLRNLEGLDVRDTASAMGCSQGSVKTHYSRAVARLREALGDHWP